jgi:hypothetical protein
MTNVRLPVIQWRKQSRSENRPKRTPAGKRNLNPPKNIVWDSCATPVQALSIDSCTVLEDAMVERTLVFGLLIASLTNVVCLYTCL